MRSNSVIKYFDIFKYYILSFLPSFKFFADELILFLEYERNSRQQRYPSNSLYDSCFGLSVYTYFRNWKQAGIFEKINYVLIKQARSKIGRNEKPSACIADSQSVKTTEKGGSRVMMEQRK